MEKKSCHDRCPYSRICYYPGDDRDDFPENCGQYYHIDDLILEAREDKNNIGKGVRD